MYFMSCMVLLSRGSASSLHSWRKIWYTTKRFSKLNFGLTHSYTTHPANPWTQSLEILLFKRIHRHSHHFNTVKLVQCSCLLCFSLFFFRLALLGNRWHPEGLIFLLALFSDGKYIPRSASGRNAGKSRELWRHPSLTWKWWTRRPCAVIEPFPDI